MIQNMDEAFEKFLKYKNRVPVRGAILLNDRMDEVLLVKGWKKSATWSFPRGKINKDEDDLDCAIREAWEETGFDIRAAGLFQDPRKVKFIEKTMRSQNLKLFVFRGVPYDGNFVPQTRKEISKIDWFKLADLPTEKRKTQYEGTGQHLVLNANKFYVVAPFMHDLKKIINAERRNDNRKSSRLAAPPVTADTTDADVEAQHTSLSYPAALPTSPAVVSSLPEVAPPTALDMFLQQQKSATSIVHQPPGNAAPSGKDLLALLRGPAAELRQEPHTPLEQSTFPARPRSPERPNHSQLLDTSSLQSPPPLFDLHQPMHPAAPSSSTLPQLSNHTRSLLDALKTSNGLQSPAVTSNLAPGKQNLLAAFTAKPITSTAKAVTPEPTSSPANGLLRLLRHDQPVPAQNSIPKVSVEPSQPAPQREDVAQAPSRNNSGLLLGLLNSKPQTAAPTTASRQDGLRNLTSATTPGTIAQPSQAAPAELSATTDHSSKSRTPAKTKNDLLSLLGSRPNPSSEIIEPKSRIGTTAARLDRPIDEPQFDAIATTPAIDSEVRREPVTIARRPAVEIELRRERMTNEKKLFDPKTGNVRQMTPIKVLKQDDRSRAPKSPRTIRQKHPESPRRPVTPKETTKPFQPQILKRPVTRDGSEQPDTLNLPSRDVIATNERSATLSPPVLISAGPLSPSGNAPQAIEAQTSTSVVDLPRKPSQLLSPVHDPQREALLSLLRPTITKSETVDADATPKASFASSAAQHPRNESVISPPSISQIVSPVLESETVSAPRSRVSSLASTGPALFSTRPVEKRQTGAEDKAFLLNYLKGFATQEAA